MPGDCSDWNCTCQGFSNRFGVDHSKRDWGVAKGRILDFWLQRKCKTSPQEGYIRVDEIREPTIEDSCLALSSKDQHAFGFFEWDTENLSIEDQENMKLQDI